MPQNLDPRQHVRVHSGMPEHPKVETLSDGAFRCLIEAWCLCRRTGNDGLIPIAVWNKRWKLKPRKEVLAAGLAYLDGDVVEMHDWLDHQPTAASLDAKRTARQEAGSRGGKRSAAKRTVKQNGSNAEAIAQANTEAIATPDSGNESVTSLEISSETHSEPDHRNGVEYETRSDGVETDGPAEMSAEGQAIAQANGEAIAQANGQAMSNQTKTKTKNSGDVRGERYVSNAQDLRDEPPPKFHPGHESGYVRECGDCDATIAARERWLAGLINATAPPRACPRHPQGTPGACRDCQAARERHEAWQAARDAATDERRRTADAIRSANAQADAELRARAIADCGMCDETGWDLTANRSCDHDPRGVETDRRGMAAVRLVLCRLCDADGYLPSGAVCAHDADENAARAAESAPDASDASTTEPAPETPAPTADAEPEEHEDDRRTA